MKEDKKKKKKKKIYRILVSRILLEIVDGRRKREEEM